MGKDRVEPYSQRDTLASKIIQQMATVYGQYFRDIPPDDFVECGWEWNKSGVEIPKVGPAFGKLNVDPEAEAVEAVCGVKSSFVVKFCCGEKVTSGSQILSVCRAAILCPFLWDDCFDWKNMVRRDRGRETHIMPLLYTLAKMKGSGDKSPRPVDAPRWPGYDIDDDCGFGEPIQDPAELVVPDAIAHVIQHDVVSLQGIMGNT